MIYFLQRGNGDIKIGTTINLNIRQPDLVERYGDLELLGLMKGSYEFEAELHFRFKEHRRGDTEFFAPCPALLDYIAQNSELNLPRVEMQYVSIKIDKHTKYLLDRIRADQAAAQGQAQTHDDTIWDILSKKYPDLAQQAIDRLGERVRPRRVKPTAD